MCATLNIGYLTGACILEKFDCTSMNALILIIASKNKDISFCIMCGGYMYNSDVKIVPASYLRRARTCQLCFLKSVSYIQSEIDRNNSNNNGRLQAQMDVVKCKWCGGSLFGNSHPNLSSSFIMSQLTCARCQIDRWKCNEERAKRGKYYNVKAQVGGMMDDQQLMGDRVIEQQQITTFAEDEEQIVHVKDEISTAPAWNNLVKDSLEHDIVNILKRPVRLTGGFLTPSFSFAGLPMPDYLFTNSTNLVKKVAYFGFFRGNLRFKLMFNATPFMSGKYLMWFNPMAGYSNRPLAPSLASKTGFPCVEIDIAKGSSVELKVPYCAPLSHYNLTNGQSYMGKLHLDEITGTLEGAAPSLGPAYALYAWFEDVELSMPATFEGVADAFPSPPAETLFAQIAVEENVQLAKPRLSAISGGVATTARLFSNIVPRWSGFLRPVEWISRVVSGAASSVGMNKPIDLRPGAPMFNLPAKGFTNMDGDDGGVVLGASPDNSLTMPSGMFSTDVDEMDLGYVTRNSCICTNQISWTTTHTTNTVLYTFPVHPGLCNVDGSDIHATTLAFVSSMFERWTGGLRFRLAVSKTAFHTGRLRITFHPSYFDTTLATSEQQNGYNWVLDLSVSSDIDFVVPYVSTTQWKEVRLGETSPNVRNIDVASGMISVTVLTQLKAASSSVSTSAPMYLWISAADDFSLAIPSNPRYCPKNYPPPVEEDVDETDTLRAQIWNETSTDSKVNQEIEDISQNLFPKAPIHPTFPEQVCIGEKIVNLRQIIKRFCKTAEGKASPYPDLAGADFAFPGPIPLTYTASNTVNAIGIDPAYFGTNIVDYNNSRNPATQTKYFVSGTGPAQTLTAFSAVVSETFQSQALLHYLSYLYTFWSGSKRYKIFFSKNASQTTDVLARPRSQIPYRVYRDTDVVNNGFINPPRSFKDSTEMNRVDARFESVVYPDLDGCIEFTVPYYSKLPISLIAQGTVSDNRGTFVSRNLVAVNVGFNSQDSVSPHFEQVGDNIFPTYTAVVNEDIGAYTLYEAAGDDFSFGYLHGAPVLLNTRAFT
jgi:hypothetical protein